MFVHQSCEVILTHAAFFQAGGSDGATPRAPTVTACALRLKPDVITQLITKYEARQRKIADHLLNRGTSNKYHFAERFRGNLTEFLESAGGLDALLAVDAVVGSKDTAVGVNTLALQSVLLLLRRHGIRVSDRPHQLQGASQGFQQHLEPSLAATLCAELGVPFVVILHPDAGNKITLQYCGDHATTTSAAHSTQQQQQPQSVPLADLPHVLQECLRAVRSGEGKFSLYLTVQAALTEAAVVRSPNRASTAGSSAASGASAAAGTGEGHAHPTAGAGKGQKVRFGSFDIKNPTTMAHINTSESSVDSPTPAALKHSVEKVVHVVTLDGSGAAAGHGKDWQQFNNPKDKKQAVIKRKEYEQAPQRIRTLLMQAYSTMMLASAGAVSEVVIPNFTPLNRPTAAPYVPGAVVLVDAPYGLLRHLCTILMTKLHSPVACSSAREEYEGLPNTALVDSLGYSNSAGNSGAYRRTLKQLMFLLISYAKQVTSGVTSTGAGSASGAQHSAAGGKGSGSGATTPSAGTPHGHAHGHSAHGAHGGTGSVGAAEKSGGGVASGQGANTGPGTLLQVHLYSVGDQQMDMLVCDAKALLGAKFA
jgi:hypothetical protein